HTALLHPEYQAERLRLGAELLEIALRLGDREVEALARHVRIRDLLEATDFEAGRREHRELRALADPLGQPLYLHFAAVWDALWALSEGRAGDVERLGHAAFELGQRAGVRSAYVIWISQWITLHGYQDLTPELFANAEEQIKRFPPGVRVWGARLAVLYAWAGQRERGRAMYEQVAGNDFADLPREMLWMTTLCTCAEAC